MLRQVMLSLIFTLLANAVPANFMETKATVQHKHHVHNAAVEKRGAGKCAFPTGDGLVQVFNTKVAGSEGWAQDGPCYAGQWCQYACEPGFLMAQWDPSVTTYSYPGSQYGGVWCDENGEIQKKISGSDYCYKGKGTAKAVNSASGNVAICQTVLPGNEAMLIPTEIQAGSSNDLTVPGTEYWAQTASHFYVNAPGVTVEEGCRWGSTENPYGNWSPYVAGFNMDDSGNTYAKIGWNPVYFEDTSPFKSTKPAFGIRLKCDDESNCVGGTCEIDPNTIGLNQVNTDSPQALSDGAAWCVVTATNNAGVSIEIFDV